MRSVRSGIAERSAHPRDEGMTVQHEWYDDDGVRYCQRCGIAEAARSSMDCPDPRVSGGGRAGVVELTRELVGIRFDAECAAEGYAGLDDEVSAVFERLAERAALAVGGGVEPSREERHFDDRTYWDQYDALRDANKKLAAVEARVVELEGALESAIYLAEDKWPVEARTLRARFLAAAGEGEDRPPRSEPDPDQPFHPCACGGDHLTIDHPSDSRLPEPSEREDPRCATCRDVGAAYCDDCSSRVRPDARSGSRLPKPTE
jgi:hypothetical protein